MDVVELDALPAGDAVAASRRAEEPVAPNPLPPVLCPYRGCIACHASAGIDRCAVQTFAGAKNSAPLIEVMFVGDIVLARREGLRPQQGLNDEGRGDEADEPVAHGILSPRSRRGPR